MDANNRNKYVNGGSVVGSSMLQVTGGRSSLYFPVTCNMQPATVCYHDTVS